MTQKLIPIVAALALLPGAAAAEPVATTTITLTSHRFAPAPIHLAGGVPVRLIFRNPAGKAHDFSARDFFANARILAGRAPRGNVDVPAGGTVIVDLVPRAGTYKVRCTKFGHAMLGMTTTIIVH